MYTIHFCTNILQMFGCKGANYKAKTVALTFIIFNIFPKLLRTVKGGKG